MDTSEPSLVPEWLRSSGSATGSGGSSQHFASSQSDGPLLALPKRNKSSKIVANSDSFHSFLLERNSPSHSRRSSSSNGSTKNEKNQYVRSYSSFTRSQRDRKRDKLTIDDHWDAEYSDPLRSTMTGRIEKDMLRRSQSMISRKQSEVLQRTVYAESRGTGHSHHENANGLLSVGGIEKGAFERDFPSLGSEDRLVTPDIGRVPSPGLSRSAQGLSIGNSCLIGGERWTSALAEVPVGVGANTVASMQMQPAVASSASVASSTTSGLNMAEALVQAQLRSHIVHQPSVQNQKREELAVLKSMRLVPMTNLMPKNVLNPCDKLKPKTPRSGDQVTASKNGYPFPSLQQGNHLLRGANVKSDAPKTSHTGKLLVLKPGRDNGISLALQDISSPAGGDTSKFVNGQGAVATQAGSSVAFKNHEGNSKLAGFMIDKKPSLAHAQSRSDFFNLMRKKSMSNSVANSDSSSVVSSVIEKSDQCEEGSYTPASRDKNDDEAKCNGGACTVSQGSDENSDNDFSEIATVFPDEEEAAFLRSLGWEENAGDDEGLTQEEINAFYQEYMKLRPASKPCRGLQLKMLGQAEPQAAVSGGPSSNLSTSDSSA